MKTIHLVYPHGSRISCPDAIGRNLAVRLRERYEVILYDWNDWHAIEPGPNDVLIGHPHPMPWTCFRRSLKRPGWRRIIMMAPFNHDDVQVAFADSFIRYSDLYLAITGNYWFSTIASSGFSHWLPKMIHLDLAVDRRDYPPIKLRFNPSGQRRFVYIGNCHKGKNVEYLSEIAKLMKDTDIAWVGNGRSGIKGLKPAGVLDFSTAHDKDFIAQYDFLITVGKADANPATILEAMAWGLIPVCTQQSGYTGYPGIINVPLDDPLRAAAILQDLQLQNNDSLTRLQAGNWALLDSHFSWDRFAARVIDAIESEDDPELGSETWQRKWMLRWAAMHSPYSPLRVKNLARFAKTALSRERKEYKHDPATTR